MTREAARVHDEAGRLSIGNLKFGLTHIEPAARFAGRHTEPAHSAWVRESEGLWRCRLGPLEVELNISSTEVGYQLQLNAIARTDVEVMELGLRAVAVVGGGPPSWLTYSGYQSWDAAGEVRLDGMRLTESWWFARVGSETGAALLLSATRAEAAATRFEVTEESVVAWQTRPRMPAPVAPLWQAREGSQWNADPISVQVAPDADAARTLVVGQRLGPAASSTPMGWLSWYGYGSWITPDEVLANAGVLRGRFARLGYRVIQIDDGWQRAFGDWQPNTRFGHLEGLVERLNGLGFQVGIWTAPFLVGADAEIARTAPEDWFLHQPDGSRLIDPREGLPGEMYVLDAGQPQVQDHLGETFEWLYRTGFRYFKIDYLYPGAYGGVRPFRECLQRIRQAVRDSYLLVCGTPLLPVIDLADGCRIADDTARPIFNFERGAPVPMIFGDEVQWAARNLAARMPLRTAFQLDADIALVGGNLPLEQARQLVTLVATSGGPFFATDNLLELPPERSALLRNRAILACVGGPAALPDWSADPRHPPAVWRRGTDLVIVYNWTGRETAQTVQLAAGRWGDLWGGAAVNGGKRVELTLPPDGVRALALDSR